MYNYNYNQFMINMLDALYAGTIPTDRPDSSFYSCVDEMIWRLQIDYPEIMLEHFLLTFNPFLDFINITETPLTGEV